MRKLLLILIIPLTIRAETGIDDLVLWREDFPTQIGQVSFFPANICRPGACAYLLYTKPYQLSELTWQYAAMRYGKGSWGLYGRVRYYGFGMLYRDSRITFGAGLKIRSDICVSVGGDFAREAYQDAVYSGRFKIYDRLDLNIGASYVRGRISAGAWIRRINLKKPYDFPNIDKPEPELTGSYDFGEGVTLSAGVIRRFNGQFRWIFDQEVALVKGMNLRLGYLSNPNIIIGGLDLSWKKLTLGCTYLASSRLNDTMVIGLSFGKE